MAITQEEPEDDIKNSKPPITKTPPSESPTTANAFIFWAYFTVIISIITLFFTLLSTLTPQDDKSWFLSLPSDLRHHYSKGRTIKVQTHPSKSTLEVFAIETGPRTAETVLLLHGLGSNSYSFRNVIKSLALNDIHAIAIDLPGSGFSDKTLIEEEEPYDGFLGRVWEVYSEIKEKGLFWGFDQLIEQGRVPYEEFEIRVSPPRKSRKPVKLGDEEMGHVIGQAIDSMNLSPVHLVLHDSAFGMSANWVAENVGLVSSVTLVDASPRSVALPLGLLGLPVVREVVLGSGFLYTRFIRFCCSRLIDSAVVKAHRVLLNGRDGRAAVVGVGRDLNFTYDLEKWAGMETVKSVPIQVLWSSSWSDEWSNEGQWVSKAIPQATFISHSGGRWPQEDAADEITEAITRFVSSLPPSAKQVEEEPLPEHIQKMFDEAKSGDHHHHGHGHGHGHEHGGAHGHGHVYTPNYGDSYGLWGS